MLAANDRNRRLSRLELLERRDMLTVPYGATWKDTNELMLGDVYVTVVFFESTGEIDPSSEDWTLEEIDEVKTKIAEGLNWWEDLLDRQESQHDVNFIVDYTYADSPIPTPYEPISRDTGDLDLWATSFLDAVNADTESSVRTDLLRFNHGQRVAHNTDWAFNIFVVNNLSERSSFPNGRTAYVVRPYVVTGAAYSARTLAHEVGHIFYALDEYAGGRSYNDRRGYYNTQNLNGSDDNPDPSARVPSITARGSLRSTAYDEHVSSPSSLAMIGWLDSDQDGVFDVLDVPLSLTGFGWYDHTASTYRFHGNSEVRSLSNLNPSGLGNDITLNQVKLVQYRINGDDWTDLPIASGFQVSLDLAIPVFEDFESVEIRTIGNSALVASPIFLAGSQPAQIPSADPGIEGTAFFDMNSNAVWDYGEPGLSGVDVRLFDSNMRPLRSHKLLEPDNFPGGIVDSVLPVVTLSAHGSNADDGHVASVRRDTASTGSNVFATWSNGSWNSTWRSSSRTLRMDFSSLVSSVSLDAVGAEDGQVGRLEAYDASGVLIKKYTTSELADGEFETMTLATSKPEIAYAIARAVQVTHFEIRLDNLRFGLPDRKTTGEFGDYQFTGLPAISSYIVALAPPDGWEFVGNDNCSHAVEFEGVSVRGLNCPFAPQTFGDFDLNGTVDSQDIDLLRDAILSAANRPLLEVDGSPGLTYSDFDSLIREVIETVPGDANLDGVVDAVDYSAWSENRFLAGRGWSEGDFNGDGTVDGSDFNLWNAHRFQAAESLTAERVKSLPRRLPLAAAPNLAAPKHDTNMIVRDGSLGTQYFRKLAVRVSDACPEREPVNPLIEPSLTRYKTRPSRHESMDAVTIKNQVLECVVDCVFSDLESLH